jgi:negative regulator of flagellin synthesis FlgM
MVVIRMRIDAFNKVSQLYKTSNVKSSAKAKNASFSDMLEISQTGKDYQVARPIVARTPDVREDRVNDIKQRMEAGTYNISAEETADKLVDNYFDELA